MIPFFLLLHHLLPFFSFSLPFCSFKTEYSPSSHFCLDVQCMNMRCRMEKKGLLLKSKSHFLATSLHFRSFWKRIWRKNKQFCMQSVKKIRIHGVYCKVTNMKHLTPAITTSKLRILWHTYDTHYKMCNEKFSPGKVATVIKHLVFNLLYTDSNFNLCWN